MRKGPSGALSPYYYKGGYFHGIHYGDYHKDSKGLLEMMQMEEKYLLATNEKRRIMMDFYETDLTKEVLAEIAKHIEHLEPCIIKLGISCKKKYFSRIKKVLEKTEIWENGKVLLNEDMETAKTWLVRE